MSQKVYIKDNLNYIEGLLKSYHKENEIIYVISDKIDLGGVKSDYPLYLVDSCYSDGRRSLRSLFDSNVDLQRFCINNFDENKRYQNMVFDLQHENRILEVDAYRYELILTNVRYYFLWMEIPKKTFSRIFRLLVTRILMAKIMQTFRLLLPHVMNMKK